MTAMEDFAIRGEKLTIEAERSVCTVCGSEFATAEQMQKALADGYARYRKANEIVAPEEIVRIRRKYGTSQKTFAKILDLGELTINAYEQGSLPTKANSNLIRLMDDPSIFLKLFRQNRKKLSPVQLRRIEATIRTDAESNRPVPFPHEPSTGRSDAASDSFGGYRPADREKLFLVAQLLLFYSGGELYKMALLKMLFYVDFASFKRFTVSMTGWSYARLPLGPVPQDYKQLLRFGQQEGYLGIKPSDDDVGELCRLPDGFRAQDVDSRLSQNELGLIREVAYGLKGKSATELKNLTHRERGWKETAASKLISYTYAADLLLF